MEVVIAANVIAYVMVAMAAGYLALEVIKARGRRRYVVRAPHGLKRSLATRKCRGYVVQKPIEYDRAQLVLRYRHPQ